MYDTAPVTNPHAFLTIQGKGGIGKSTLTKWLNEYLSESLGRQVHGFELEAVTPDYSLVKSLGAFHIPITQDDKEGDNPDAKKFGIDMSAYNPVNNALLEGALRKGDFVIDVGASAFDAYCEALMESEAFDNDFGSFGQYSNTVINCVMAFGSDWDKSKVGLEKLVAAFKTTKIVFWLNYRGHKPSTPIDELKQQLTNLAGADRVLGFVDVPHKESDSFASAIDKMQSQYLTFDDVLNSDSTLMNASEKQLLRIFRRDLYTAFDAVYKPLLSDKAKPKVAKKAKG